MRAGPIKISLFCALLAHSAQATCIPFDPIADANTSGIQLFCRGFVCENSGRQFDDAAVLLLNMSAQRRFIPPENTSSAQICANVSLPEITGVDPMINAPEVKSNSREIKKSTPATLDSSANTSTVINLDIGGTSAK